MEGTYIYSIDMLVKNIDYNLKAESVYINYKTSKAVVTVGDSSFINRINDTIVLKTVMCDESHRYDLVKPYAFKDNGSGLYTYYCNINDDKEERDKINGLLLYRENN